jgi:hypothetical protein
MKRLLDRRVDPPKGWYYTVPQTGVKVLAGQQTWNRLVEDVEFHYLINGLDVPEDLEQLIDDSVANRVPKRYSEEYDV